MIADLIKKLAVLSHSQWYWWMHLAGGISFMVVALIFQHGFDYEPCVTCIQIRLWVTLWIVAAIIGMVTLKKPLFNAIAHVSIVLVAIGLTERSYLVLGTERGFVFGDCGFDLGLPTWFAIEEWLPSIYRVETSCGYTPELLFGVTMAEFLMVSSVALLLFGFCISLVSFLKNSQ